MIAESEVGFELVEEQLYCPPAEAIQRLIADTHTTNRAFTGIAPLDAEMRGISAGQLAFIVGYAHSGKTLVASHIITNNRDRKVALFSPDEPAPLVWIKIACAMWGVSGAEMEARIADNDPWAARALGATVESYPNLMVIDRPLNPRSMTQAYEQMTDRWGAAADLVVVDYLDLLKVGDSPVAKADYVKGFGTTHEVPMIVLHQTSRSAGSRGQEMRIDSGNFGGETHATYQIGVWRKKNALWSELTELEAKPHRTEYIEDRISYLRHLLEIHQYTVTVNLNKNKRPSGRLLDGFDFEVDLDTGVLTLLAAGALPEQYRHRGLRSVQ